MFLGFFYTTVALVLSMWIFHRSVSLVSVFLTVVAAFPLFYDLIRHVARQEYQHGKGKLLWREHAHTIEVLFALFIGVVLGFVVWYVVLPVEALPLAFESQQQVIVGLSGFSTAEPSATMPVIEQPINRIDFFTEILLNNLSVLLFCVLFSFLYGAGAVFIIVWNASVLGVALGNFMRGVVSQAASVFGIVSLETYFHAISLGVLRYFVHGIPEIMAYLIAGVAGSMISLGLFYSRQNQKYVRELLADVLELSGVAIMLLVISAWLEAFVSTAIF